MQPNPPTAKFIDKLTEIISKETDPTKKEIYTHMLELAKAAFDDICDVESQFDRRLTDLEYDLRQSHQPPCI